jgi:hypothetical protein
MQVGVGAIVGMIQIEVFPMLIVVVGYSTSILSSQTCQRIRNLNMSLLLDQKSTYTTVVEAGKVMLVGGGARYVVLGDGMKLVVVYSSEL